VTKRSDALQALVHEVVDLDVEIGLALATEEEARQEFVRARQALDDVRGRREALEGRRKTTDDALGLIRDRDEVTQATVEALMKRAGRR
jgi:uncharacterized protein YhaN